MHGYQVFRDPFVKDGLSVDLEILDYLEIFNNMAIASEVSGISQSTYSRRYRAFSESCGFDFDHSDGFYHANANHDVLANFRQAAQSLRVRNAEARIARGWQAGSMSLLTNLPTCREIAVRPMNSWSMLSILEQRLIDVAIMGIMEFQGHLSLPMADLRFGRQAIGKTMMCIPLCQWDLQLIATANHPLSDASELNPDVLSRFPSPSLPIGSAPVLMMQLQTHGLGSQAIGMSMYDEQKWEGFVVNGHGLSYSAPFQMPELQSFYGIKKLNYELGIRECLALVGHRDVLSDPSFGELLELFYNDARTVLSAATDQLLWLH